MKKRTVAILLAIVLVFGAAVGGTLAWLLDTTAPVTNTFTVGDVEITLTETPNQTDDTWSAQLVPGTTYAKDPKVTVESETNVPCYLFVKVDVANNEDGILQYGLRFDDDTNWKQATGLPANVWYREVAVSDEDQSWYILDGEGTGDFANGKVTINSGLTKGDMPTGNNLPSLTFTAYAVQKDNLDVAAAWALVG